MNLFICYDKCSTCKKAEQWLKDNGVPYDPLAKADPDITLSAEERQIGGLGIFLVKKNMDDVKYEYVNGSNILTLKKGLRGEKR